MITIPRSSVQIMQRFNKDPNMSIDMKKFQLSHPQHADECARLSKTLTGTCCTHWAYDPGRLNTKKFGQVPYRYFETILLACQKYIEARQHQMHGTIRILTSGNQGKIHSGWRIPEKAPPAVTKSIQGSVWNALHKIHDRLVERRRSDSFSIDDDEKEIEEPTTFQGGMEQRMSQWVAIANSEYFCLAIAMAVPVMQRRIPVFFSLLLMILSLQYRLYAFIVRLITRQFSHTLQYALPLPRGSLLFSDMVTSYVYVDWAKMLVSLPLV